MSDFVRLKAPRGWINDPNGFIYYKGEYHLFYQHFPYAPIWGRMHWGHAVSKELMHWEHKDIALYPSKPDDRSGCFSGSAVEHNGRLHIFYTGVSYKEENPQNINTCINDEFTAAQMSITSENGYDFDNLADKFTVIPPIEDKTVGCKNHTRDPKVWRGKYAWYMVLGSTADRRGRLLFYKSSDLVNWEYVNFAEKDGMGWMWECPDYFETDGTGVIVISPLGFLKDEKPYDAVTICALADFDEASCKMDIADKWQLFDCGEDLYAPQSTADENGRRVIIAWARMPEPFAKNRRGMFCIPRIVEVRNGHIYFRPHPNAERLFTKKITSPSEAGADGYKLSLDMDNGEEVNIGGYKLSRKNDIITADRSDVFAGHSEIKCVFHTPEIKEGCHLDIYVDPNLIEVYVNNGEYVLTNTVYGLSDEISAQSYELYAAAD